MKKIILLAAVILCGAATLAAQDRANLAQYLNIRSTGAPSLSPDASRYAFLWNVTGTNQIWVCKTDGGFPEQITFFDDRVDFAQWSPAADLIIFGKSIGGNEKTQLYSIKPDGSALTPLTNNPKAIHDFGGFSRDG
ncbi:MAG: DPP IV N-terminal domain-containing protein, partial [Rhizobacter sp.]|nr:DPP IV N-terminal domain-containing protein [Chlorobiales bacterium]